jgi:hypothetical protein
MGGDNKSSFGIGSIAIGDGGDNKALPIYKTYIGETHYKP